MIYGMARSEALPRFLGWVYPARQTPVRAIAISMLLASAFAMTGKLAFVAGATNFAVYVAFASICVSLLVLRYKRPDLPRPFLAPLTFGRLPLLPLAGLALVALQIANLELDALALGVALLISGIVAMQALSLWRPASRPRNPEPD